MLNRHLSGSQWAAVTAVAAAILLASALRDHREVPVTPDNARRPVVVEVRGDVKNPGVHMPAGPTATVAEAVAAAGGFSNGPPVDIPPETASRPVPTGRAIHVVRTAAGGVDVRFESMTAAARLTLGLRLDLNEASEEDLLLVPHMKPEFAREIASRRNQTPWKQLDELTAIPGIGPRTVQKWRDYLRAGEDSIPR